MRPSLRTTCRRWLLPVATGMLIWAPAFAETPGGSANSPGAAPGNSENEAAGALPSPEAWEAGPDRETLARFARAYGQVSNVLGAEADPLDESLGDPEQLPADVGREVERKIDENGLETEQWETLLRRMEQDEDFRTRVEMLALPYRDAPSSASQPQ